MKGRPIGFPSLSPVSSERSRGIRFSPSKATPSASHHSHPCHPERSRGTCFSPSKATPSASHHSHLCHPERSRGTCFSPSKATPSVPITLTCVIPSIVEGPAFQLRSAVTARRRPQFPASSITSHIHFSSHARCTPYFLGNEFDALIHRRAQPTKTGFLDKPLRVCERWKFTGLNRSRAVLGQNGGALFAFKRRPLSRESIKRYEGRLFSFVSCCSIKLRAAQVCPRGRSINF